MWINHKLKYMFIYYYAAIWASYDRMPYLYPFFFVVYLQWQFLQQPNRGSCNDHPCTPFPITAFDIVSSLTCSMVPKCQSLCLHNKNDRQNKFFPRKGDINVTTSKCWGLNMLVTKFYKFMGIELCPCYALQYLFPLVLDFSQYYNDY